MGKDLKGKELGKGITQRKDGRYQARFVDRFGKRRCVYGKTLKEVKNALMTEVVDDYSKNNVANPDMTLNQWYEKWMRVYKEPIVKKSTATTYKRVYKNHIKDVLGNTRLSSINQIMVADLLNQVSQKGLSIAIVDKTRVVLSNMFKTAVQNELCTQNPVTGVKITGKERKKIIALKKEDQRDFLIAAENDVLNNLFIVALNTGLRSGELRALTFNDIDFDKNIIKVNKTILFGDYVEDEDGFRIDVPKTKSSIRTVPMNSLCINALKNQIALNQTNKAISEKFKNYVFLNKTNIPITPQYFVYHTHRVIKRANKMRTLEGRANIPLFSPHTFRHTFATRCFEAGIPPKTVQTYLGHASLQITMDLYTEVLEEKKYEDIKLLEQAMNDINSMTN